MQFEHHLLMDMADFPTEAWLAFVPDELPRDVELLGPMVWRVGPRVLKCFPGAKKSRVRQIARAHRQARRIFRGHEGHDAQRLIASAPEHRVVLLEFVEGKSGRMELLAGAEPQEILQRAAAWMHILHSGRETTRGVFRGIGPMRRLAEMPDCAQLAHFERARRALQREAETLEGRETGFAVLHGDLTLANLLFRPDAVTGIDFENLGLHPAARDVGEAWADLLLHLREMPEASGLMPAAWIEGFAKAYPALEPEVCAFYARHRLLKAWAAIPPRAHDRGPGRDRQYANILRLVANGAFRAGVLA